MKDTIDKAYKKFGKETQLRKTVEELSELIVAICKNDDDNVLEELGDVYIVLEYAKKAYNIEEYILRKTIEQKIARLEQGMESGEYE